MSNAERRRAVDNSGALYGLGVIGAAFYFVGHSSGFWAVLLGLLKAVAWPALVVYKVLERLSL